MRCSDRRANGSATDLLKIPVGTLQLWLVLTHNTTYRFLNSRVVNKPRLEAPKPRPFSRTQDEFSISEFEMKLDRG